jgi:hypothetical protein
MSPPRGKDKPSKLLPAAAEAKEKASALVELGRARRLGKQRECSTTQSRAEERAKRPERLASG